MTSTPMPSANVPPASGPIGEPRKWLTVALLSIVTCGIYFLWWEYKTFEELKQHNGTGLGGAIALVIGILLGIVNAFILPSEIKNMYERDGRESPVQVIEGLWLLLPIVGFFIWTMKMQEALNDYWISKGAAPLAAG
ncbi:MAG: DUF4234 domain-containing protein [Actinomycetota bacterium]|nr:DUF4234 domain-containing protein [Actinomycetota bacterium]